MFFDELVSPPGASESYWSLTAQWTIIAGEDRTTCIAAESRVTGSKGRALVSLRQSSAGSWSSSYVAELGPPSLGSPATKADSLRRESRVNHGCPDDLLPAHVGLRDCLLCTAVPHDPCRRSSRMPVVGLCPGSGAAPARRARLRGIAFRGGVPFVTGPRWPARRDLESRLASRHAADANSRIATGEIAVAQAAEPSGTHPGLMMPTRTQVRSHRIAAEAPTQRRPHQPQKTPAPCTPRPRLRTPTLLATCGYFRSP